MSSLGQALPGVMAHATLNNQLHLFCEEERT
jgi:hypothetical protein